MFNNYICAKIKKNNSGAKRIRLVRFTLRLLYPRGKTLYQDKFMFIEHSHFFFWELLSYETPTPPCYDDGSPSPINTWAVYNLSKHQPTSMTCFISTL